MFVYSFFLCMFIFFCRHSFCFILVCLQNYWIFFRVFDTASEILGRHDGDTFVVINIFRVTLVNICLFILLAYIMNFFPKAQNILLIFTKASLFIYFLKRRKATRNREGYFFTTTSAKFWYNIGLTWSEKIMKIKCYKFLFLRLCFVLDIVLILKCVLVLTAASS